MSSKQSERKGRFYIRLRRDRKTGYRKSPALKKFVSSSQDGLQSQIETRQVWKIRFTRGQKKSIEVKGGRKNGVRGWMKLVRVRGGQSLVRFRQRWTNFWKNFFQFSTRRGDLNFGKKTRKSNTFHFTGFSKQQKHLCAFLKRNLSQASQQSSKLYFFSAESKLNVMSNYHRDIELSEHRL